MFKRIMACIVAALVILTWIPVYADSGNVTKEVWDMTGLQMLWESEEPNADGLMAMYTIEISPAEGDPKQFEMRYLIKYYDEEWYSAGSRYFSADIPAGDFAFKNHLGDTLDFSATLTGTTEIRVPYNDGGGGDGEEKIEPYTDDGGDGDGEYEVIEETIRFDLHAVLQDWMSVMGENHTKLTESKVNVKTRGDSWQAIVSGSIGGMEIQEIEGNLSTMTDRSMTISKAEPEPEPEPKPEPKATALEAKGVPPEIKKPDVAEGSLFGIYAYSGGMKEFEYEFEDGSTVSGEASFSWNFIVKSSGDFYYLSIIYQYSGIPTIYRAFWTEIPVSELAIPSDLSGGFTLDLNLVVDVEQRTVIMHYGENPDEEFMEEITETFENVPLPLHLVLDISESSSTMSVVKIQTEDFKQMHKRISFEYLGVPSGTVDGEDIGEGYYAGIDVGEYTTRTNG